MHTTLMVTMTTALVLSACATYSNAQKSSTLDTALFNYGKAIRWSEFGLADSMRRLPAEQKTMQPAEQLEHIRVTSYEHLGTTDLGDGSGISVTARIAYYRDDGMKLNTVLDYQVWKYDEESHSWYIITPLPEFR